MQSSFRFANRRPGSSPVSSAASTGRPFRVLTASTISRLPNAALGLTGFKNVDDLLQKVAGEVSKVEGLKYTVPAIDSNTGTLIVKETKRFVRGNTVTQRTFQEEDYKDEYRDEDGARKSISTDLADINARVKRLLELSTMPLTDIVNGAETITMPNGSYLFSKMEISRLTKSGLSAADADKILGDAVARQAEEILNDLQRYIQNYYERYNAEQSKRYTLFSGPQQQTGSAIQVSLNQPSAERAKSVSIVIPPSPFVSSSIDPNKIRQFMASSAGSRQASPTPAPIPSVSQNGPPLTQPQPIANMEGQTFETPVPAPSPTTERVATTSTADLVAPRRRRFVSRATAQALGIEPKQVIIDTASIQGDATEAVNLPRLVNVPLVETVQPVLVISERIESLPLEPLPEPPENVVSGPLPSISPESLPPGGQKRSRDEVSLSPPSVDDSNAAGTAPQPNVQAPPPKRSKLPPPVRVSIPFPIITAPSQIQISSPKQTTESDTSSKAAQVSDKMDVDPPSVLPALNPGANNDDGDDMMSDNDSVMATEADTSPTYNTFAREVTVSKLSDNLNRRVLPMLKRLQTIQLQNALKSDPFALVGTPEAEALATILTEANRLKNFVSSRSPDDTVVVYYWSPLTGEDESDRLNFGPFLTQTDAEVDANLAVQNHKTRTYGIDRTILAPVLREYLIKTYVRSCKQSKESGTLEPFLTVEPVLLNVTTEVANEFILALLVLKIWNKQSFAEMVTNESFSKWIAAQQHLTDRESAAGAMPTETLRARHLFINSIAPSQIWAWSKLISEGTMSMNPVHPIFSTNSFVPTPSESPTQGTDTSPRAIDLISCYGMTAALFPFEKLSFAVSSKSINEPLSTTQQQVPKVQISIGNEEIRNTITKTIEMNYGSKLEGSTDQLSIFASQLSSDLNKSDGVAHTNADVSAIREFVLLEEELRATYAPNAKVTIEPHNGRSATVIVRCSEKDSQELCKQYVSRVQEAAAALNIVVDNRIAQ